MRLAIVCEYFYPDSSGSTPTDLSELVQSFRRVAGDIEINVITSKNLYRSQPGQPQRLPSHEIWDGIRILRLGTARSNQPSLILRLLAGTVFSLAAFAHLLLRQKYDVLLVVTNPPANGLLGWLYSKTKRRPYIYFINDIYPDVAVALGRVREDSLAVRLFHQCQRAWLHAAVKVVVVGRCMQQRLIDNYQMSAARIAVVQNWADPAQIRPSPRENSFRQTNRLDGLVVLYGGNFGPYIDFDLILGAAHRLVARRDITFVLIGDGARRAEIEERISRENLSNVRLFPPVARVAMNEVMAAADICLIPLDERMKGLGSPGKLYTTLAAGRPVIAIVPEGSEVARVVTEEQCGVTMLGGDAELLAAEIERLQADPELREGMGKRAREALLRRFTLTRATEEFLHILREAAWTETSRP